MEAAEFRCRRRLDTTTRITSGFFIRGEEGGETFVDGGVVRGTKRFVVAGLGARFTRPARIRITAGRYPACARALATLA